MDEQKHYSYVAHKVWEPGDVASKDWPGSGKIEIKSGSGSQFADPSEFEIKEVHFLVPVRVYMEVKGEPLQVMARVDFARGRVHFDDPALDRPELKEKVVQHLRLVTTLPENEYQAGPEVYDEVRRARTAHQQMRDDVEELDESA